MHQDNALKVKVLTLFCAIAGLMCTVLVKTAHADDILINCVTVGDDAGTTGFVTLSRTQQVAVRPQTHDVRHKVGLAGTVAGTTSSILDKDKTVELCVAPNDTVLSFYKVYDGGNPQVCVYNVRPVTGACPVSTAAILLAVLVLGQDQSMAPLRGDRGRARPQIGRAGSNPTVTMLEFATASGEGMTAPCACTTLTGTKGETLTFTRASSATCLIGATADHILNGDMVTCAANKPRAMPGGDGSGVTGLMVEGAATNLLLRSQELDDVVWGDASDGVAHITVTANAALAPDETLTADRLQIPATTGVEYSQHYQLIDCGAAATFSVFVKGRTGFGTLDICGAGECVDCNFTATSWTRCKLENSVNLHIAVAIGNVSSVAGVDRAANDVYAWGAQCEATTYQTASSYIPTTTVAVTRAGESANFAQTYANAVAEHGSTAATILAYGGTSPAAILMLDHTSGRPLYHASTVTKIGVWDGTNDLELSFTTLSPQVPNRFSSSWGGTRMELRNATDGTAGADLFDGLMSVGTGVFLGSGSPFIPGAELQGVIKQVCLDPHPEQCR